jgi:hypothetical protein
LDWPVTGGVENATYRAKVGGFTIDDRYPTYLLLLRRNFVRIEPAVGDVSLDNVGGEEIIDGVDVITPKDPKIDQAKHGAQAPLGTVGSGWGDLDQQLHQHRGVLCPE